MTLMYHIDSSEVSFISRFNFLCDESRFDKSWSEL
jgi:hypothetical protein